MRSRGSDAPSGDLDRTSELAALRDRCAALERDVHRLRADASESTRTFLRVIEQQRAVIDQALSLATRRPGPASARDSWLAGAVAGVRRWVTERPAITMARRNRRRRAQSHVAVPPSVAAAPLGMNVSGYISAESGMGEATRCSLRALQLARIPFALNNVAGPQRTDDPSFREFTHQHPHPFNLVHLNADNMASFARDRGPGYFRERYTIGFWFWELEQFRSDFARGFDYVDEVWVASDHTRQSIGRHATVPIVHIPLGIRPPQVGPFGRDYFGIPAAPFVFLYTFDASSQIERKNPLAAIRAFRLARFEQGQALLVLKFTNGHADRAAVRRLAEAASGLDVILLDVALHRHEMASLMNVSDACVSLHRAEGFGMTIAEHMLLGKPAIASAYSGNLDFMTPAVSRLVDCARVPITRHCGPYLPGYLWAEPDVAHAAAHMRELVEAGDRGRALGALGAAHVSRVLAPARMAARIRSRLRRIQSEAGPSSARAALVPAR